MDPISYGVAAKQKQRIEQVIANPDSTSGIVTTPSVIATGETITIPAGRTAVLPNTTVNGTLDVQGTLFVPAGGSVTQSLVDATVVKQNGSVVANDSTVVHKTGDETKAGVLTLTDGLKLQGQNVSPFSGFKNYIINGNFDVWQRGASGVSVGSFVGPDMWSVWAAGANTNWAQASSADFAPFGKKVSWGLTWRGDPASSASPIEHRIESINAYKLSGKKLTLSFLAKCSSNTTMNIELFSANSSDNFIGTTLVAQQGVSLTTTTQLFSITFDLTNTDVRYGCSLVFRPSVPAAIHWIAQVQLEEGSVATPFEQRPIGLELSLCQRYYEVSGYLATNLIFQSISWQGGVVPWVFKQTKRITPTIGFVQNTGTKMAITQNTTANSALFVPSVQASSVEDYIACYATASAEL